MKRVVLLGDSIRLSYQDAVRARLQDVAFVWAPPENGQHSVNLLLNFAWWVDAQQPDVLHLNAGLWDTRRAVRGKPDAVVPLPAYRENVRRLLSYALELTPAKVIWATTTPVIEERIKTYHARIGLSGRDPADIARYNAAAVEEATRLGVAVNDLNAVVTAAGPEKLLQPDGTHYNEAGVEVLADAVAKAVRQAL